MTSTSKKIKSTFNAFERQLSDFLKTVSYLDKFANISEHFLVHVDGAHLVYYLKEFYLRMSYVFDIQDTLEFGRLRTESQTLLHNAFLEPNKLGCYMAVPHDSDKALKLTSCSHEGIQYWLEKLEQSSSKKSSPDNEMALFIETMSLKMTDAGNKLHASRQKICELTKSTILDAFHVRKPKKHFQLKDLLMTAYFGYSISFSEGAGSKKVSTTWHMFPELTLAAGGEFGDERDFRLELSKAQYTPVNEAYAANHAEIITMYEQKQAAILMEREAQAALNAKNNEDRDRRNARSKEQLELKKAQLASITDPLELNELRAAEESAKRRAKRCFDDSAGADGSESSSGSDSSSSSKAGVDKHKIRAQPEKTTKRHKHKKKKVTSGNLSVTSGNLSVDSDKSEDEAVVVEKVNTASRQQHSEIESTCSILSAVSVSRETVSFTSPVSGNKGSGIDNKHTPRLTEDQLFSGTATDDSLLHNADVGSDLDNSDDDVMDFDNPGVLFRSAVKDNSSKGTNEKNSGRKSSIKSKSTSSTSRKISPAKTVEKIAAEQALMESKEAKLETAKKKRDDFKTERRIELANVGSDTTTKKKRGSCAISSDTAGIYTSDFDLNLLTATNKSTATANQTLIANAIVDVVGAVSSKSGLASSATTLLVNNAVDFLTMTPEDKMSIVDRNFKEGLMMYCQMELVKDVTFEKLMVNYCIAKREASGALENEILDIDWFEVMTGFRISLEKRLVDNKEVVLDAIKLAIDDIDNEDLNCVDREAEKDKYVTSAEAWLKHGVRMIRGVVSRCVNKIGSYWETLNFLPADVLKSSIMSNGNNKSSLFGKMTSHSNLLLGNYSRSNGGSFNLAAMNGVGIDSLLYQVIRSNNDNEDQMNNLIKFTKIPRDKYKIIPHSQVAMENWLVDNTPKVGPSLLGEQNSSQQQQSTTTQVQNATSGGNNATRMEENINVPSSPATSTDSRSSSVEGDDLINSNVTTNKLTAKLMSLSVDSSPLTDIVCLTDSVKYHMRDLLKVLYAGVCGKDLRMCLKVNAINNSRNTEVISFMRFLEGNSEKSIEQMALNFEKSTFFKLFTCNFFVPFRRDDRSNIMGDGYCFYRTMYVLYIRSLDSAFEMTAEDMKILDSGLRSIENDMRAGFFGFFDTLNACLPEEYGKSRVLQSRFLFFHIMNCSLDQRFWGVLDGVAFLPFECTGFGEHDDPLMSALWVKYYCSSIFGIVNKTVDSGTVGTSPTFADVSLVLAHHPNFALFKGNHFFVSDHHTKSEMQSSFDHCLESILGEFKTRLKTVNDGLLITLGSSSESTSISWADICDRMDSNISTQRDVDCVRTAVEILVHDLQVKQVIMEEEAEKLKASAKHRKAFVDRAPVNATEDQKRLFTLTTKYKETKHKLESVQSELDGIKRMIQKNLQAKDNAVDLITSEENEIQTAPQDFTSGSQFLHVDNSSSEGNEE